MDVNNDTFNLRVGRAEGILFSLVNVDHFMFPYNIRITLHQGPGPQQPYKWSANCHLVAVGKLDAFVYSFSTDRVQTLGVCLERGRLISCRITKLLTQLDFDISYAPSYDFPRSKWCKISKSQRTQLGQHINTLPKAKQKDGTAFCNIDKTIHGLTCLTNT